MNTDLVVAIVLHLKRQCIVEVFGIFGIDRACQNVTHVTSAQDFFIGDSGGYMFQFAQYLFAEGRWECIFVVINIFRFLVRCAFVALFVREFSLSSFSFSY